MSITKLDGAGRQKCAAGKCKHKSLPGLIKGKGLCPYHWCYGLWGKDWADQQYPEFNQTKEKTT